MHTRASCNFSRKAALAGVLSTIVPNQLHGLLGVATHVECLLRYAPELSAPLLLSSYIKVSYIMMDSSLVV